jgi:hypothetical protein
MPASKKRQRLRDVGVLKQGLLRVGVGRNQGDADAHRDQGLLAVEVERPGDLGQQAVGQPLDVGQVLDPDLQHGELVPAEAGDGVDLSDTGR